MGQNTLFMDAFDRLEQLYRNSNEDEITLFIFLLAQIKEKNIKQGISLGSIYFRSKPYLT